MDNQTRELMFSSTNPDYETPDDLFKKYQEEFGITHDVCAEHTTAKCESYWTKEDDCLTHEWSGVNWINPPYNKPEKACRAPCKLKRCEKRGWQHNQEYVPGQIDFVRKAYEEACAGRATTIALLPARTDTDIFHNYIWDSSSNKPKYNVEVRFLKGRVTFKGAAAPAPFPSMIVIFKSWAE
jgi:phage N-6-adenine-methyltransferase